MKKSIIAIILVLSVLLTFAACGEEKNPTAYELVNSAIKKTQSLDTMDAKMIVDMSMEVEGFSMEIPLEYDMKAVDLQSGSPKLDMVMKVSMMGMSVSYDCYYENGYYYIGALGQNMKVKAEVGDDYDALGQAGELMIDLEEKYLKDVAVTIGEGGKKTVAFELDNDTFQRAFDKLIDSTGGIAASGGNVTSISIPKASVEITVDTNGYIDTYKAAFEMEMTVEAEGTSYDAVVEADISIQYNNPGAPVTVTAPDGYKNYPEANPDVIG